MIDPTDTLDLLGNGQAGLMQPKQLSRRQQRNRDRVVSIHEAGHAAILALFGVTEGHATIEPKPEAGAIGHVDARMPPECSWLASMVMMMAGPAAEDVFNVRGLDIGHGTIPKSAITHPLPSDDANTDRLAKSMLVGDVARRGDTDFNEREVSEVVAYAAGLALVMIDAHRPAIRHIADRLMLKRTVPMTEIVKIVNAHPKIILPTLKLPSCEATDARHRAESRDWARRVRMVYRLGRTLSDDEQAVRPTTR